MGEEIFSFTPESMLHLQPTLLEMAPIAEKESPRAEENITWICFF